MCGTVPDCGRGRRRQDRGVYDRALRELQALVVQMPVHRLEQLIGQPVLVRQRRRSQSPGFAVESVAPTFGARPTRHRRRSVGLGWNSR